MKNIILVAPPFAGKGTLSDMLVKRDNYLHISTGNILKEMAEKDSDLKEYLKSGKLVDDKMILNLLKKKLETIDGHFILDGFPRTLMQAESYDELLRELGLDLGLVFYLNIPEEELLNRVNSRIICSSCKKSYSLSNKELMPKEEGVCDDCGATLVKRDDDTEEIFKVRLKEYQEKTEPILNYYRDKGVLVENNSISSEDSYQEIRSLVRR